MFASWDDFEAKLHDRQATLKKLGYRAKVYKNTHT